MNKEQMINKIIKVRGFEDEKTIWFCRMCEKENIDNQELNIAFKLAINSSLENEEEF